VRERALRLLTERGADARAALPALAKVMTEPQPAYVVETWTEDGGIRFGSVDSNATLHPLAAAAVLAIAAPDDPLAAEAKEVLRAHR
jgi:hypothetical protein